MMYAALYAIGAIGGFCIVLGALALFADHLEKDNNDRRGRYDDL